MYIIYSGSISMKMKLEIQNFGPINEAKIDIGKINVIAGKNASGKTTSSKLFYCLLASVSSDGKYLADRGIVQRMIPLLYTLWQINSKEHPIEANKFLRLSASLNDIQSMYNKPGISLREVYNESIITFENTEFKNKESYLEQFNEINELLNIKDDIKAIYGPIMYSLLEMEFDGAEQILNNYNNSKINFYGQNNECEFKNSIITKNSDFKVDFSDNYLDCLGLQEISYIETPYIFDFTIAVDYDLPFKFSNYHQKLLMRKLRDSPSKEDVYDKVANKNIIDFQERIEKIINGKFKFDEDNDDFKFEKDGKSFTIKNTAAGLKQIGIIQLLLANRKLPKNSYLIMDEPEVHLHPEWQIKLAEIIVLLAKELNITLYINSHSPQFIEAIEVYSKYHDINGDTNFYLTKKCNKNGKFNFNKIENDKLQKIYRNLGDPYDIIDEINGMNIVKELKGSD